MRYLIIKEDVCPDCNGNYKQEKEVPNYIGDGTHMDLVYCTQCYSGKIRTEVDIKEAFREMLSNDRKFRLLVGSAERFPKLR